MARLGTESFEWQLHTFISISGGHLVCTSHWDFKTQWRSILPRRLKPSSRPRANVPVQQTMYFFTNHDVTWFANNYVEFNWIISILEAECQDTPALGFYLFPLRRLIEVRPLLRVLFYNWIFLFLSVTCLEYYGDTFQSAVLWARSRNKGAGTEMC